MKSYSGVLNIVDILSGIDKISFPDFVGYSLMIIIIVALIVWGLIFYSKKSDQTNLNALQVALVDAHKMFTTQLTDTQKEYIQQNTGLNSRLHDMASQLMEQQRALHEKALADEGAKNDLRLEIERLKSIQETKIKEMVLQEVKDMTQQLIDNAKEIERLKRENEQLKTENEQLKTENEQLKRQKEASLNHANKAESE